jgi:integrase
MPAKAAAEASKNHHLFRRGNSEIWWCVYKVRGVRRQTSLGTTDVQVARQERDRLLLAADDARAGRVAPPPPVVRTWTDAADAWLKFHAGPKKSGAREKTHARYSISIAQLTYALCDCPLAEITKATVIDFIQGRREEGRAASTIKNDLTAWNQVMDHAEAIGLCDQNPLAAFPRKKYIEADAEHLNPPEDALCAATIAEVAEWSAEMALLMRWLRETGMRLNEALSIHRSDVNPGGLTATVRRGVKRNASGDRTRVIHLGRAADMLAGMPTSGRLFSGLHPDVSVTSTRYGQWRRQRQGREDRAAEAGGREPVQLPVFRLHDLRHGFALASIIDDPDCIYRLAEHLGHSKLATTEIYLRFLKGEGYQRRFSRRPDLFGSLPTKEDVAAAEAADAAAKAPQGANAAAA